MIGGGAIHGERDAASAAPPASRETVMQVHAVIICYHPDLARLRDTCDRVVASGAHVVLVDNSEPGVLHQAPAFRDCTVVVNHSNLGIARGQNLGIQHAVANGADAVLFLDQDSEIGPGFLASLIASLEPGVPNVVAPVSRNAERDFEYVPTRVSRVGLQRKVPADGRRTPYRVDIVMSSGTVATVEALERVGGMDEDLFIDFVDLEWCLRCRREGVPIRVVPAAVLMHRVGGQAVDLPVATVLVHSPTRCYYQIRNCFRLFRTDSVPTLLALRESLVMMVHKTLLLVTVSNRREYASAYLRAIRDGIAGVSGKLREG